MRQRRTNRKRPKHSCNMAAHKSRPGGFLRGKGPGRQQEDSGDHRLSRQSTIMGPAGLTAVFGMGTGVTPPVWSPEKRPGGGQAARATGRQWGGWSQREHIHITRGQVELSGTDLLRVRIGE